MTAGIIAAGHPYTAKAARIMLEAGGNAFDAALAGWFAACVVEPVLTSLGGGGFLLARRADGQQALYDYFAQTPRRKRPRTELDFFPIHADFGTATQEFHIGMGSIATPGAVKGAFRIHRDLCRLPMSVIVEPAIQFARRGVRVNRMQADIFRIIAPILRHSPAARRTYGSPGTPGSLIRAGEKLRRPRLADTMEALAREGAGLFYRGEIARQIVQDCRSDGGYLRADDLAAYRVIKRKPLRFSYRGADILTNPPPSSGGMLIGFAMKMLEGFDVPAMRPESAAYLSLLTHAMALTNAARDGLHAGQAHGAALARRFLGARHVARWAAAMGEQAQCYGGTSHISVVDASGNMAAMTNSNGEGSGYVVPGTGIMLNNMLGEEDINPQGFHRWQSNSRIASMMSPTVVMRGDTQIATGSGGSNRIRTAIMQVLINILDFNMDAAVATRAPRIHFERGLLNVEHGFRKPQLAGLLARYSETTVWKQRSLFFGGVHTACYDRRRRAFSGAGDPRRGGVAVVVGR